MVCTVEGYNLVVNERWKNRWPQSSGHAAHPQPANQHRVPEVCKVEGTYDGTLWYSVTRRPHQNTARLNIPDPKKIPTSNLRSHSEIRKSHLFCHLGSLTIYELIIQNQITIHLFKVHQLLFCRTNQWPISVY